MALFWLRAAGFGSTFIRGTQAMGWVVAAELRQCELRAHDCVWRRLRDGEGEGGRAARGSLRPPARPGGWAVMRVYDGETRLR